MSEARPNLARLSVSADSALQMMRFLKDEGLSGPGRSRLELHATALRDPSTLPRTPTSKIKEHGFGLRAELAALRGPVSITLRGWVDDALNAGWATRRV